MRLRCIGSLGPVRLLSSAMIREGVEGSAYGIKRGEEVTCKIRAGYCSVILSCTIPGKP